MNKNTMPRCGFVVAMLLAAVCAQGQEADTRPATAPADDPLLTSNAMHQHAEALGRILVMKLDGRSLAIDRQAWTRGYDAEQRNKQIEQITKALVKSGMDEAVARDKAEFELVGRGLSRTVVTVGKEIQATRTGTAPGPGDARRRKIATDRIEILLLQGERFGYRARELGADVTWLEVKELVGGLLVSLRRPDDDWIVWLHQTPKQVVAMEIRDGELRRFRAPDFLTLCIRRPDYVEDRLLGALRHYGMRAEHTPYSPATVKIVLDMLAEPLSEEEHARGKALLEQLAGDSFKQREEATDALRKGYPKWMGLIRAAAKDPAGPEQKARLESIIKSHRGKHPGREMVVDLGLLDNPAYLAGLLGRVAQQRRAVVLRRLRKLTGRDLGDDPAAWRKQLSEQ